MGRVNTLPFTGYLYTQIGFLSLPITFILNQVVKIQKIFLKLLSPLSAGCSQEHFLHSHQNLQNTLPCRSRGEAAPPPPGREVRGRLGMKRRTAAAEVPASPAMGEQRSVWAFLKGLRAKAGKSVLSLRLKGTF